MLKQSPSAYLNWPIDVAALEARQFLATYLQSDQALKKPNNGLERLRIRGCAEELYAILDEFLSVAKPGRLSFKSPPRLDVQRLHTAIVQLVPLQGPQAIRFLKDSLILLKVIHNFYQQKDPNKKKFWSSNQNKQPDLDYKQTKSVLVQAIINYHLERLEGLFKKTSNSNSTDNSTLEVQAFDAMRRDFIQLQDIFKSDPVLVTHLKGLLVKHTPLSLSQINTSSMPNPALLSKHQTTPYLPSGFRNSRAISSSVSPLVAMSPSITQSSALTNPETKAANKPTKN